MNFFIKNFDSEFCGSLPLNFINQIQPHGILLVLEKESLTVLQASENIKSVLGVSPQSILNKPLNTILKEEDFANLAEKVKKLQSTARLPMSLQFQGSNGVIEFSAIINFSERYLTMELETLKNPDVGFFGEVYQEIKYVIALLKDLSSVEDIARVASEEIKKFSGFDRVMIYKFDDGWNGNVIAEAKEEALDSYLGFSFPASDIPKQARDLYFRTPYRFIPDVDFKPVKLIPIVNPLTKSFTDLSDCNLRSVASVHIEYLNNMKVKSSMSTPIIINNKLWGLISCHHTTPKYLNYEFRAAFELLSSFLSVQIAAIENRSSLAIKTRLYNLNFKILEKVLSDSNLVNSLLKGEPNIMDLLRTTGAAIRYENNIFVAGEAPSKSQIENLTDWAALNNVTQVFATHNFPEQNRESKEYKDVASGLIILPIDPKHKEYIFGFRKEVVQSITWGGNPYKALNFESNGKDYHPRSSFEKWKETVKETANPWLVEELEAADILRSSVLDKVIKEKHN